MASINPFLPIQEGTGTPSPENVRPIKPAVSIAGGKNLLEISQDKKVIHTTSGMGTFTEIEGGIQTSSEYNNMGGYLVQVKPNTTYIYSANFSISNNDIAMRIWEYKTKISVMTNAGQGFIVNIFNPGISKSAVFTTSSTTNYIIVGFYTGGSRARGLTITNMMIEEGSVATSYEPYQSLDVYGGYLDIANSRIVEEWDYTDLTSLEWNTATANRARSSSLANRIEIPATTGAVPKTVCEKYTPIQASASLNTYMTSMCVSWEGVLIFYYDGETLPSGDMAYKLATPVIHTLSPTQFAQAIEQLGIKLSSTLIDARRKIILNSPHIETASGSIASFKTDMKAPLKECKIHFLPVQSGSGDPSPTNIRPISGWTRLNAEHSGENLFPSVDPAKTATYSGITIYNDGNSVKISGKATGSLYRGVSSSWVADGERVYIYGVPDLTGTGAYWYVFDDRNLITGENINGSSFTTRSGKSTLLAIGVDSGWMSSAIDIEFTPVLCKQPSTQIPVSFGENGTIYGGYVDLVTGELVAEYCCHHEDGQLIPSFNSYSTYNRVVYASYNLSRKPKDGSTSTLKCNYFKSTSAGAAWNAFVGSTGNILLYIPTSFENTSQWREYVANNLLEFCYELETPITYQLTPQQLKALKGTNNIWSDANGNIDVKYWKH